MFSLGAKFGQNAKKRKKNVLSLYIQIFLLKITKFPFIKNRNFFTTFGL
jgi:hypothetical protein